jgi:hypothetical protein
MAWFAEGLQEGCLASGLEWLLVDAPLADECIFEDLARSEC